MPQTNNEARILLALQAYKNDPELSLRRAAKLYQVNFTTLLRRHNGVQSRANTIPKPRKLSNLEEEIVIKYILDLNLRGFPPRLRGVEEMTSRLVANRDMSLVGKRWARNFVNRHEELDTRFSCNMTIKELNAKIQLLLMCSYGLQRRLRKRPSPLPLGVQRPQRPFLRLNFNLNTLKDKSENIIVAPQNQF